MTVGETPGAERGGVWLLALLVVAGGTLVGYLFARTAPAMTSATEALAASLLVAGAALVGLFLRRARIAGPLVPKPGWRWLDPGALLYAGAALAGLFVLFFVLTDAQGLAGWITAAGALALLAIVAASPWALEPREVQA